LARACCARAAQAARKSVTASESAGAAMAGAAAWLETLGGYANSVRSFDFTKIPGRARSLESPLVQN